MIIYFVGALCDIGKIILYPLRLPQDGATPLIRAAENGHVEVVRLLLNADPPADVNKAMTTVGTRTHHSIISCVGTKCHARPSQSIAVT